MRIILIMMILLINGVIASAQYRSSSDTGVEVLDYIENRRREERANRLTDEQKELLTEIDRIKSELPNREKENEVAPAVFEGDDLKYDAVTGEFIATGRVDIIQIDGHRFQSKAASGNVREQVVRVKDNAHMLQLTPNAPRVTLDGYRTVYNYGTKTGTMGAGHGKAGEYYISGKRFEFYPDHVVVYDGTQTKCGASRPDYHVSAKKMEIWSGQVIKMYGIKFWLGSNVIGQKDYDERKLDSKPDNNFPKVGYNKDMGAYVEQDFEYKIVDHFKWKTRGHFETKNGIRSSTELRYENRDFQANVLYGYYHDNDNVWLQKEPTLELRYGRHFGKSVYGYNLKYDIGHWRENNIKSTHQNYEVGLWRDPIWLGRYVLYLWTWYTVTKESRDESTVRGMNYAGLLAREFDDRFAMYTKYQYTKNTTENSLFDYENDDYARKFSTGMSYRLTNKDRFVVGMDFDTKKGEVKDVDYYWFHDLHCSQLIMRYREKRDKFEAHWQFTPW